MAYYVWVIVNILIVASSCVFIWIFRTQDSRIILLGQLLAQVAILLFFINVNMYFIFLVIRRTKMRNVKIALAKLSRKMMRSHIWIGVIGTMLILFHGGIMLVKIGGMVGYTHTKVTSGLLSLVLLSITLFAGYLRHKKSSGNRRRFHFMMAFLFVFIFIVHILLPI